ncbi:MAG: hypothetical protein ACYST2_04625 [Planctomycetota bacterium]
MKRIVILTALVLMLVGLALTVGCENSAKVTAGDEVIQASAYAEGAEAVNTCGEGCEKPCCDKDKSTCPKAASGCPKAASGCSKEAAASDSSI